MWSSLPFFGLVSNLSKAARSRPFASSSSLAVAPGKVSEVSEDAPASAGAAALRIAPPAFFAFAPALLAVAFAFSRVRVRVRVRVRG